MMSSFTRGARSPFRRRAHLVAVTAATVLLGAGPAVAAADSLAATQAASAVAPPSPVRGASAPEGPRSSVVLSTDPTTQESLLFGGTDGHDFDDTWTYLDHWVQRHPDRHPAGRAAAAAAFDPVRGEHVLFGGIGGGVVAFGDTWTWTGTDWTPHTTPVAPAPRGGAALAHDAASGTMILFGGSAYLGPFFGDTWRWTGAEWQQLSPTTSPPIDMLPAMASIDGKVVLFDEQTLDTWTWDATTWTRHPATDTFVNTPTPGVGDTVAIGVDRLFAGSHRYDSSWRWDGAHWTDYRSADTPFAGQISGLLGYGPLRDTGDPSATWRYLDGRWTYIDLPLVAVAPQRVLDTRSGPDQRGYLGAKPVAGDVVRLSLRGRPLPSTRQAGAPLPPGSAVVLNVTGTEATADGYVTVWPCNGGPPLASNLNLTTDGTRAALVVTTVSSDNDVCLYTQSGAHLVADLVAWFPPASPFHSDNPRRLLDTRPETAVNWTAGRPSDGQRVRVLTGNPGTVFLNITGLGEFDGFVSVVPCDATTTPTTSNLNLTAGAVRSNVVLAIPDTNGAVCLFTQRAAHLVVDMLGDLSERPWRGTPARALDTRQAQKPAPGSTTRVRLTEAVAPADTSLAVLNVTGTEATGAGFVTVWGCDDPFPLASTLNLDAGATASVLTVTAVGPSRDVCLYSQSGAHLVVDVAAAL